MTHRPVIALVIALLVESARWTKLRWEFDEDAYSRAWQMTTVLIAIAAVLIYMEGNLYTAMPTLLTWLPALLLPMQFVQSYGMKNAIPLHTFSFLAKHRRLRNLRLGLTETVVQINFGNIFFIATLVAATLGSRSNGPMAWAFLPGMIVLTGWILLASSRSRPSSLIVALAIAGGLSLVGQMGLRKLNDLLGNSAAPPSQFTPNSNRTNIGKPGPIQQSPAIIWRLRPQQRNPVPRLLRVASYNLYRVGNWEIRSPTAREFSDLDSRLVNETPYFLTQRDADEADQMLALSEALPRFKIRGAASAETPLTLPGDTTSLAELPVDSIERNGFGTVRVYPKQSVVEGTVLWQGTTPMEDDPIDEDREMQAIAELPGLDTVLSELQLDQQPTLEAKLTVLREWFQTHFRYSRSPSIVGTDTPRTDDSISQFLLSNRSGHCEYFATATALLLRRAGIPTRYTTGYAVAEFDSKRREFVIRGIHGHAWCRVWNPATARWIDFDTTPPSWIPTVGTLTTPIQRFDDMVKRLREDFFLWRNQPTHRLGATLIMWAIAAGVGLFVGRRLWKSKRRIESRRWQGSYQGEVRQTALNALEPAAKAHLGPRPLGQPYGAWLAGLRPTLDDPHSLDEAIALHQQLRFDPQPHDPTQAQRLAELARQLAIALKRS
jgi:hypothetical protein